MPGKRVEIAGYGDELPLELLPGMTAEEQDDCYERIRQAFEEYEDAVDPPLCVTLTRRGPLRISDDELDEVLSVCRDAMVDVLGTSADHSGVRWVLTQSEGAYALLVEVRPEPVV